MHPTLPEAVRERLHRARTRRGAPAATVPARLVVVDVPAQRLWLLVAGVVAGEWPVSTAERGVGGEEGSLRTPPGWHRIAGRIGAGAAVGTVFSSREPTGEVWRGEPRDEDLVLTRVLTLDGLEDGVNRGAGRDSHARYIYLHGTNHEDRLGTPASHGCVRMANAAVGELFEQVREGDPVVVLAEGPEGIPDPRSRLRFHYAGVGGSGMSALAQYQVMRGGRVSGSDRGFDHGGRDAARAQLERLGNTLAPQDGSGAEGDCAALVVSTAVESSVPDVAVALRRRLPIIHRSEMLAHWVERTRSVAVSGTSGKSTVVAMVFEILRGCGRDPSVITGGDLVCLQDQGLWGNAWAGTGEVLVVEADESDGSLVRYRPALGVALNLTRDHKSEDEVHAMFTTLRARTRERFVCGEDAALAGLRDGAVVFGHGPAADVRGEAVVTGAHGSQFEVAGTRYTLPVAGRHNVDNALAALAVGHVLGLAWGDMAPPLAGFRGVGRRFQSLGTVRGIEVVDDFAHNPAKIAAALATAQLRAARVLAVFQPHGYGPTRFLRAELVEAFARGLRPGDEVHWLEVFYAGGSAVRDFSAADLAAEVAARGRHAEFAESRDALLTRLASAARPGDLVLVMGARDPSLTAFAHAVRDRIAAVGVTA